MASVRWIGNALAVKKVVTVTPANVANTNTFTVTMNGKDMTYTAGASDDVASVSEAVAELINDNEDDIPEFYAVSAESNGSAVVVTGNNAGEEWTLSSSASGGTATFTTSTTTQATGPHHWDDADNWDTGTVPANSDVVWIDEGTPIIKYGLDQSSVTLTSLNIPQLFDNNNAQIGLPSRNSDYGVEYQEYLDTYLKISATTVNIGTGDSNGARLIKLNVGSNQCALKVFNSALPIGGEPTIQFQGTHSSNTVSVTKGSVGLGYRAKETTNVATLRIGHLTNPESDSNVICGRACTVTTINKNAGRLEIHSGCTTLNHRDGTCYFYTGACTTANVKGGTMIYNSPSTLGTLTISGTGHVDFGQDPQPKTITNPVERYGDQSRLSDPDGVISSLVIDLNQSEDLTGLLLGDNYRITRGSVA